MNYESYKQQKDREITRSNRVLTVVLSALMVTGIAAAGAGGYYVGKSEGRRANPIDLPEEFPIADSNSRFLIVQRDTLPSGQVRTTLGFSDDRPIEPGFYFSREDSRVTAYSMQEYKLVRKVN